MVEKGFATGRDKAKSIIMAGLVYVDNQKADKAGDMVDEEANVEFRGETLAYVSRGGLKLEKAMAEFGIKLDDCITADIGASTGGFTDCMLQNGAVKVYAIDVGYGQLAWKLRTDPRVVNLERTNIRYVTDEQVEDLLDFLSIDVSFISLALVLPVAFRLLKADGEMVCLVKPQFEAGKELVGKKGVVREASTHQMVIEKVIKISCELGFKPQGLTFSPVKGPEGNIEYLLYLKKGDVAVLLDDTSPENIVKMSHSQLDN